MSTNPLIKKALLIVNLPKKSSSHIKMNLKLFNNIQVTVFLASLTDGSSTGVADGESVDGSAFVERISVRKRTKISNQDFAFN